MTIYRSAAILLVVLGLIVCQKSAPRPMAETSSPSLSAAEIREEYEQEKKGLEGIYEQSSFKPHKIRVSSGHGSGKVTDRDIHTGWRGDLIGNKPAWIELIVNKQPDDIMRYNILPSCYSKEGKKSAARIKKLRITYSGLLKKHWRSIVAKEAEEADHHHGFSLNKAQEVDFGSETAENGYERWIEFGGIDDINGGDESIYATKIRIEILELEPKTATQFCISEIIFSGR